jgi:hypothetical protein
MESGEERFESYLREFDPRRPRALPAGVEPGFDWRRLAAAAALLIALGASTWFGVYARRARGTTGTTTRTVSGANAEFAAQRLSIFSLTRTALEDPRRLDAELSEQSRRVLPDFRGKESTLSVLAKP